MVSSDSCLLVHRPLYNSVLSTQGPQIKRNFTYETIPKEAHLLLDILQMTFWASNSRYNGMKL
jgi:hypothetical protein